MKPWGRFATFGLAFVALMAGQFAALTALTLWYGRPLNQIPDLGGDGVGVTLIIFVSTPIEVALLALFARRTGIGVAGYLGWNWPPRSHVVFGIGVVVAFIVVSNVISWVLGRGIVTDFQVDIFRTASAEGWLVLLWLAVVVVTPVGEETLFRGWMQKPTDAWPVIIGTALLFALLHVQYDWFVIGQVFAFGVLLGWMRWATGSTILTMLLHAIINFEGMLETGLLHG